MKLVNSYVGQIRRVNDVETALQILTQFGREVHGEVDSIEEFDEYMKRLFEALGKEGESELRVREKIINLCSTTRFTQNGTIAKWVRSLYEDLGYPIGRLDSLDLRSAVANLHKGERWLSREVPYDSER
jgi:hypothetical protein